jgi:hypothetical protein
LAIAPAGASEIPEVDSETQIEASVLERAQARFAEDFEKGSLTMLFAL